MEFADILSAGDVAIERGLTADDIRQRFRDVTPGADRGAVGGRGDHNLNPELEPLTELRDAAVLVPLVDRPRGLTVLLTQRTTHLSAHAGQIAFPGGRVEPEDADRIATALRETEEEIGLDRRHIEPVGALDRYVTGTGFMVTPIVGLVHPPFALTPDPNEVADAFEVPLAFILDPANRERQTVEFRGIKRVFYAYPYEGRNIWGATAGMLANLAELLAA